MTPTSKKPGFVSRPAAFSLIEMVTVIAILVILMTAGVSLLGGSGTQSRKAATDTLAGLVEQARTRAITTRSQIILAIAEPGDLPATDGLCRIALFRVDEDWPDSSSTPDPLKCTLLNRWQSLNTGVVLLDGQVDGVENPMDNDKQITISYGGGKNLSVKVHAIAFGSRGGLYFPSGSTPVAFRIAEGGYRSGKATANKRGESKVVTEDRLKIGRVTARPYRIDG